jgi:hypothetical protein
MLIAVLLTDVPTYRLSAQSRPQPLTLAGRLVLVRGADTVPVPDAWVVAHRVGPERQGALDSLRSDARGRFRFTVPRPESLTVYLVSSRYAGIGYFSEPFDARTRAGADSLTLAVFDTASGGAPLAVASRHVVVTRPEESGLRRVLDVVDVRNDGVTTRIGADSLAAVWRMRLPGGVNEIEVGQSEFAASAIRFENGEVLVAAPFPPGEKQVAVTYVLPADASRFTVPVDQPTAEFSVLAEDSLSSAAGGLARADPLVLEGRVFQRFVARNLAAGARPAVSLAGGRVGIARYWWLPIAAVALALVAGAIYAARARVAPR